MMWRRSHLLKGVKRSFSSGTDQQFQIGQRADLLKHRQWVDFKSILPTSAPNINAESDPRRFTVSTFNLLCQHYVWPKVFNYQPQKYLDWDYRLRQINSIMGTLRCDIMCFQEMENNVYNHIWKDHFKEHGYESLFIKKQNPEYWQKSDELMDGVGIFVNKAKFEIVNYEMFDIGDHTKANREVFGRSQDLVRRLFPRNTVALVIRLRNIHTKQDLFVANTHLYWSPKFNDVKVIQSKVLLDFLDSYIQTELNLTPKKGVKTPLVICGDFNSNPYSAVYRFLNKGNVAWNKEKDLKDYNYGKLSRSLKNPFNLSSAYSRIMSRQDSTGLKYSVYTKEFKDILDYIWFNKDSLSPIKLLSGVDPHYLKDEIGFPNDQFPSDHIPLATEFEMKDIREE